MSAAKYGIVIAALTMFTIAAAESFEGQEEAMGKARDMTEKQFDDACIRRRFVSTGVLGYYKKDGGSKAVSVYNAGKRRREQLKYLIKELEEND